MQDYIALLLKECGRVVLKPENKSYPVIHPGKCPLCRQTWISPPLIHIEGPKPP